MPTPQPTQTKTTGKIAAVAIVIIIVVAVILGLVFLIAPRKDTAAYLTPADTEFFLSYDLSDSNQRQALSDLAETAGTSGAFTHAFEIFLRSNFFPDTEISFADDIKPWLAGEVALAKPKDGQAILFFKIKSARKAHAFIDKIEAQDKEISEEEISDAKIYSISDQYYLAEIDGYLASSKDKATIIRSAELASTKNSALVDDPNYRKLRARANKEDHFIFTYFNGLAFVKLFLAQLNETAQVSDLARDYNLPTSLIVQARKNGLWLNIFSPEGQNKDSFSAGSLSQRVPEDTSLYFEGENLADSVTSFANLLSDNTSDNDSNQTSDQTAAIDQYTRLAPFIKSLDLSQATSFLTGRYAVAILPGEGLKTHLALIADTVDQTAARDQIEGFISALETFNDQNDHLFGVIEEETLVFQNQEIIQLKFSKAGRQSEINIAAADKLLFVSNSTADIETLIALTGNDQPTLHDAPTFQQVTSQLDTSNSRGLLFINTETLFENLGDTQNLTQNLTGFFAFLPVMAFSSRIEGDIRIIEGFLQVNVDEH